MLIISDSYEGVNYNLYLAYILPDTLGNVNNILWYRRTLKHKSGHRLSCYNNMRILFIIMFVLLAGVANFELKMLAEINITEIESQF